ncbi:MAG TPA: cysteine rich repeat-containing protein [Casimicrobiaceae bacterium]
MTGISKLIRVAAVIFVVDALSVASSAAFAQGAEQACAADIQSYCAGVSQGEGRIAQCLRTHKQQLSPGCQRGMASAGALMKEVVQACEDDVHRYCAGAAPGTTKECLRTNFRQLSFGCKRELFEAKKGM